MTTEAEESAYPLADPRGVPIPFDIGDPEGLWIAAIGVAASSEKTLPSGWEIVVLYATQDCVIGFGNNITLNLTADVEKADHQMVPAGYPVTIRLPSLKFKVIGTVAGTLYIQKYRRWKAVQQAVQTGNI